MKKVEINFKNEEDIGRVMDFIDSHGIVCWVIE